MAGQKGFMTEADREFLRGEREYTGENAKQMRYQRRQSIRERTRGAFHDFALLHENLDGKERNKIFDPPEEEVQDLKRALQKTIAFLYHALEGDVGDPSVENQSFNFRFDDVLEVGIRNGEKERHPEPFHGFVEYDPYSVSIRPPSQSEEYGRIVSELAKNGGRWLTDDEIRAVVASAANVTASKHEGYLEPESDEARPDFRTLAERIELAAEENADEE